MASACPNASQAFPGTEREFAVKYTTTNRLLTASTDSFLTFTATVCVLLRIESSAVSAFRPAHLECTSTWSPVHVFRQDHTLLPSLLAHIKPCRIQVRQLISPICHLIKAGPLRWASIRTMLRILMATISVLNTTIFINDTRSFISIH